MEDSTVNFHWIKFAQWIILNVVIGNADIQMKEAELRQTLVGCISKDFFQDHRIPQRK